MDLFKEFIRLFTDQDYSIKSKLVFVIILLGGVFFIDNILGFSFFYVNQQRINQLEKIEQLKKSSKENKPLVKLLEETEEEIINRQTVIDAFLELFSKNKLEPSNTHKISNLDTALVVRNDTLTIPVLTDSTKSKVIEKLANEPEDQYRSRLWHTLTSSYLLILVMFILPISGITQKPFRWPNFIGILFTSGIFAGLVWLNQFLLGLIPVLFNQPWINYILNFAIQTFIFIWIGLSQKNNAHPR
ncbi:MAG: hypothetical protein RIC03_04440 [Cyclobacteriaceae bacterium]